MPEYFLKTLRNILNLQSLMGLPYTDRIMFGTDWPYLENVLDQKSWVDFIKNIPEKAKEYDLKFSQEEINKISTENAKRFLKW
jgi:predicted TIM-barrel fold metal-dependent hydrolase